MPKTDLKQKLIKKAKQEAKQITRANAAFAKLSKAEQRVAIAKDVLKQLKAKKIRPKFGVYLGMPSRSDDLNFRKHLIPNLMDEKLNDKDLQEVLQKIPTCEACALGSMFYCSVKKYDNYPIAKLREEEGCTFKQTEFEEYDEGEVIPFLEFNDAHCYA